ncbi:MAG TPA: hypothetical protein VFJ76_04920 [Solirubrobacterales bacterium]|nr:hypothetical protein [Solirubrobacterales bacterium]
MDLAGRRWVKPPKCGIRIQICQLQEIRLVRYTRYWIIEQAIKRPFQLPGSKVTSCRTRAPGLSRTFSHSQLISLIMDEKDLRLGRRLGRSPLKPLEEILPRNIRRCTCSAELLSRAFLVDDDSERVKTQLRLKAQKGTVKGKAGFLA